MTPRHRNQIEKETEKVIFSRKLRLTFFFRLPIRVCENLPKHLTCVTLNFVQKKEKAFHTQLSGTLEVIRRVLIALILKS